MSAEQLTSPAGERVRRSAGWPIVASKEFADHVRSVRFVILVVIVSLAGLAAVNSASSAIRDAADRASGVPSVFLLLFTASPERVPSYVQLVGFLGPLLGIAFGFDAVSGERSQRTLPRLVSQPIHRDDVINGKFAAGLGAIAVVIGTLTAVVCGYGILRVGLVPGWGDIGRLIGFFVLAMGYVGFWLALSIVFSVLFRRAATAALGVIACWLVLTLFSGLIAGVLADTFARVPAQATAEEQIRNARLELTLERLSPSKLFDEATNVVLDPSARATGILRVEQLDRAIPSTLPLDQSLILVWPQTTFLLAGTVVLFALAYVLFLRQEVRA